MDNMKMHSHPADEPGGAAAQAPALQDAPAGPRKWLAQAAAVLKFSVELMSGGRNLSNRVGRDDSR